MHSSHLQPWGLIPVAIFCLCCFLGAELDKRMGAAALERHPGSYPAIDRAMRARHGRRAGGLAFRHLRHDPVIARYLRWSDGVRIVAIIAWLLFMLALVRP